MPRHGAPTRRSEPLLYIIYQEDGPDGQALRDRHRQAHFDYLKAHEDIVVLGGAMLAEDGKRRTGSVLIVNVPNRAAADKFSENEPLRQAGVFREVKISRMRRGQWNPAAAPATAEGN
ncbi:MAG: YciI family protein [Alphaproteobacteria bacterium]|nr:YciI family protein [Alphaproteobacteria bacterium]